MNEEKKGLSPLAYEDIPGEDYPPYIPPQKSIAELTLKAVITGILVGVVFGAANAYLGLRVGITVSASIPAAVIGVAVFQFFRKKTILETNMVQTIGSAGESLAAGVIFTIPAILILGFASHVNVLKIFTIAALGGILGVLFMIPLRKYLIKREHGKLPYPEGTACADVLVAGEVGGKQASILFKGMGLGALYLALMKVFALWKDSAHTLLPGYRNAMIGIETTPELLGVGFIIGPRIAAIMLAGGALSWLVFIPLLSMIGEGLQTPLFPEILRADEQQLLISDMSPSLIWNRYIRYIGAGAVAFGGVITLIRAVPTIWSSFSEGLKGLRETKLSGPESSLSRTDRDLPMNFVLVSCLVIILLLWLLPQFEVNIIGAMCMVIFSFFFVTVSSRIVGLIGSTSNPVSGMTIATLLATSLVFVAMGWTGEGSIVSVLIVGGVVCISAAIAGDTSQDLKTGFLVGATPRRQQIGEFIGVLTSAMVIGSVILMLNNTYVIGSSDLPAPQANLMALVVKGILSANLPWGLVLLGIFTAAILELLGIPSLPFAVGVYLPISLSTPIMAGGLIRLFVDKIYKGEILKKRRERGILSASGLIAGAAFVAILNATILKLSWKEKLDEMMEAFHDGLGGYADLLSLATFLILAALFIWQITGKKKEDAVSS